LKNNHETTIFTFSLHATVIKVGKKRIERVAIHVNTTSQTYKKQKKTKRTKKKRGPTSSNSQSHCKPQNQPETYVLL